MVGMSTNNICHSHQLHSQKQKMYIRAFVILYGQFSEEAMAPTPVLLPGKSHGRRSLVGCNSWGR